VSDKYQQWIADCEQLLASIKAHLPQLETWLEESDDEDMVYRFYHGSMKAFHNQYDVEEALKLFKEISPRERNSECLQIVKEGSVEFNTDMNRNWLPSVRPVLEAYWHTRYFVTMMIKCAKELTELTEWSEHHNKRVALPMPYGWAAVLYLYNLRSPEY
jgi:hypothetical protein